MAITILSKNSNDKFFTIEDSSIFSSKSSKAVNQNAMFANAKRNHMEGFAAKHVQAALQNIARDSNDLVSGNKKDEFVLNETIYAKLREFYSLDNQSSDFKSSMEELQKLEVLVNSAKDHATNSTKTLDIFRSSAMQALLTSEDVKRDLHIASETLKKDLEYNHPNLWYRAASLFVEIVQNFCKFFYNIAVDIGNALRIVITTDLEKRQAALEIDYCASNNVKTIDELGSEQSTQLRLLQGVIAEFDANRVNQDTLVSKKEVDDYITNLIKGNEDLEKALGNKDNAVNLIVDAYTARDLNQESARNDLARKNHKPGYMKYTDYTQERYDEHKKLFEEDYNKIYPTKNEALSTTEMDPKVEARPRRLTSLLKEYQEAVGLKNNTQELAISTKGSMTCDELNIKKSNSVTGGKSPEFEESVVSFEGKAKSVINGHTSQNINTDIDKLANKLKGQATTHGTKNEDKNNKTPNTLVISTGDNLGFQVQPLSTDKKLSNLLKFITDNTNQVEEYKYGYIYHKEADLNGHGLVRLPRCILDAYKSHGGNWDVVQTVTQLENDIAKPENIVSKLSALMTDANKEYNGAKSFFSYGGYNTQSLQSDLKSALSDVNKLNNVLNYGSIETQVQKHDTSNLAFKLASENQVTIESDKSA
ncbi:hypothetical protein [Cysteiniphilum halobium]|uniref:hypothetical protein n=1 Tax=Cysteiniphilum halobium TaxID=2219059 RepID=UPI000E64DF5A|nr:hypothetical protein [Cysteiniphilum halobium]